MKYGAIQKTSSSSKALGLATLHSAATQDDAQDRAQDRKLSPKDADFASAKGRASAANMPDAPNMTGISRWHRAPAYRPTDRYKRTSFRWTINTIMATVPGLSKYASDTALKLTPAPILAHDQDIEAAIFCIRKYAAALKSCAVEFVVPVNHLQTKIRYQNALSDCPVRYFECDSDLKSTFDGLIRECGNADWVLWLTADRYPIASLNDGTLERLFEEATSGALAAYSAVKFCRWRETEFSQPTDCNSAQFADNFEERPYTKYGFWQPQLIKLDALRKVLAAVDTAEHPRDINDAVNRVAEGLEEPTLYPKKNVMKTEEPIDGGKVTINYEARRLREAFSATEPDRRAANSCSFNSPVNPRMNRYWQRAKVIPEEVLASTFSEAPFHVVSFGGSGSKVLAVGLFSEMSDADEKHVKSMHSHRRLPPRAVPSGMHLIYIHADPRDAVFSFFNRRERRHSNHDFFGAKNASQPKPDWVLQHLRNLEADSMDLTEDWDISRYLQQPYDFFRLEEHLDNWMYATAPYRITFIRYETLWENAQVVAEQLGLPKLAFRAKIKRNSDWRDLPAAEQGALDRMYGGLAARLNDLPDVFYAEGGQHFDVVGNPITFKSI